MEYNKVHNEDCLIGMNKIELESINLILTDPPYGILPKGKIMRNGKKDSFKWDNIDLEKFTTTWFNIAFSKLRPDSFMYIFWSQKFFNTGIKIFNPNRVLFWRYNNLINNNGSDFAFDYEPIFVIKKGNPKLKPGKHSCDLEFVKPQSNFKNNKLIHPTQKPIDLIKHLILLSTKENDIVLDCFMGSGTTAVACKELNRRYIGFETDETYYNTIIKRMLEKQ